MGGRYEPSPGEAARLIREQVLGLVVTDGPGGFQVTPLPLLAETDAAGEVIGFFGHFALTNPQVETLKIDGRALILFQGPHAYVSPSMVSKPDWAPTWNYAVARYEVEATFVPEENRRAIEDLAQALEGEAWSVDRLGDRYERLLRGVIAFRARVTRAETRFKLGQDESDAGFREILSGLGPSPLTELMRRARPGQA